VFEAQAIFLLEHGHSETYRHTVTDATAHPIYTSATAGVANNVYGRDRTSMLSIVMQWLVSNYCFFLYAMDRIRWMKQIKDDWWPQ